MPTRMTIGRILVLRGGALGDFLITLPALGLLRARWPAARIELAGNARAAELGVLGGYLDHAHSQDEARWSSLFADAPLPPAFAAWLGEFDLVVNYWPDPGGTLARRFPVRSGQAYLADTAEPTTPPAARHFCELLKTLGPTARDYRSRLPRPGNQFPQRPPANDAVGSSRAPIAIHPGSGSPSKNWPDDRWLELAAHLDGPFLLVLGEAERERWNSSLLARFRSAARGAVEVADNLALPALAAALAQCRLFLGHDSGVSHLAAAMGTPCVLLFGPTEPSIWAPPGPHVRVIRRGPGLDSIAVEDVGTKLLRFRFIAACQRPKHSGSLDP